MVSIHAYDTYLLDLQAIKLYIKYKDMKINKLNRKINRNKCKMSTHSVVYSDKLYPMFRI